MAIYARVLLTQGTQDTANNRTYVTATLQYKSTYGSWDAEIPSCKLVLNGSTTTFEGSCKSSATSWTTMKTKSAWVTHSTNGTKTVSASAKLPTETESGTVTASASKTLTTIPRESSVNIAESIYIGTSYPITISRESSSFTHTLKYRCGTTTATIATGVGTSYTWTPPTSLYNNSALTSSASATLYLDCYTYSGSTLIGSHTDAVTVYVPTSIKPTVSSISLVDTNSDVVSKFGFFVQNKSTLTATGAGTAGTGASIKSAVHKVNGTTYSSAYSVTGIVPTNAGTGTHYFTLTDSRSRTATYSSSYSVEAYSAPTLTSAKAVRCNSDGTVNDRGTKVKVTANWSITSLQDLNDKKIYIDTSEDGSTWTTVYSLTPSAYSGSISEVLDGTFNIVDNYVVRVRIMDYFSTTLTAVEIPTGYTLINYGADGKSMTFGGICEGFEGLQIDMDVKFNESMEFNGDVDFESTPAFLNGSTGIFPIGHVLVKNTKSSPASDFGGTWTLVGKDWSDTTISKTYTSTNATLTTAAVRSEEVIRLRISVDLKVALGDTAVTLGTISLSDLGFTSSASLSYDIPYTAASDGGNALVYTKLGYNGNVLAYDTYDVALESGDSFYILATINAASYTYKADSACDKFYWRRTA